MTKHTLKAKASQAILHALAGFLYRFPVAVLVLFLGLTVYFGSLALKLEQKTTLRDLMPPDNPAVQNFEATVRDFDLIDRVVVVLQFEPDNLEYAEVFAELLVEEVSSYEEMGDYLHWLKANLFEGAEQTEWHSYLQYLTRLVPEEQLPNLIQRLSPEGIDEQVSQNRRDLESGLTSKNLIATDPLNLMEFAGSYLSEITGNFQISFTDGFLVSKDKDMMLILGKPTRSPEDVDFSVELDQFLKDAIEKTKVAMVEEEDMNPEGVLTIGLTGPHPIAAHENKIIKDDVTNMFVTSFAFVLLLFVLAYRRPLAILYVGFPLLCAEVWTLGIGYLLFGRLNLLTATFSAIIVGLGIDYAIHIFSRYLDERSHERTVLEAMELAIAETGLGTAIGGITTASAFLAMGLSNFTGLREFAVIASIGIALCLLQMFVMLPCMLFIRERLRGNKKAVHRAQWDFRLNMILSWVLKHKNIFFPLLSLATIYMGYEAVQLRFTSDIRSVRAKSNPSINLQNEVTAKVGGSLRSLTFVLEADSQKELYYLHDQMLPTLSELKAKGDLVRFDSLLVVLQNEIEQRRNMQQLQDLGIKGEQVVAGFKESMAKHHLRITDDSSKYVENIALGMDAIDTLQLAEIYESQTSFVRPFLHVENGRYKSLIHVYPSTGLWEKDRTRHLTQTILDAGNPQGSSSLYVTGIQTIADELKALVKSSFQYSTALALGLVFLILYLHFRKLSLIALTLVPLLVSVCWMLGTMKLLGIDITLINFVATPLIIGIGIDDGVHIVEKYLHRKSDNLVNMITLCGKAVTLTSLTTIFGFSSLFLAEYSGFQSLGLCSILGVFYCWLGSVILLPLFMEQFGVKFVRDGLKCEGSKEGDS